MTWWLVSLPSLSLGRAPASPPSPARCPELELPAFPDPPAIIFGLAPY